MPSARWLRPTAPTSAGPTARAGPLLGVPLAVKDEIDLAGEVTSRGTDAFRNPAPADAEGVRRLERRSRALGRPGALVSDRMAEKLLAAERRMAERVGRVFDDHDVLLMPVMSEPAVSAGVMEGRGAITTYLWETSWVPFSVLWNSTGQPAASAPAGFSSTGLPLAVQLVGRPPAAASTLPA